MSIDIVPQDAQDCAATAKRGLFSDIFDEFLNPPRTGFAFYDPCRDEHGKLICDHDQCRRDAWEAASGN